MIKLIKVEKYNAHTFSTWTDGAKTVLDLKGTGHFMNQRDKTLVRWIACFSERDAIDYIRSYSHAVGTIYVWCSIVEFFDLPLEDRPELDIRLLIV